MTEDFIKETSHNTTMVADDYHAIKQKYQKKKAAAHAGKVDGDADYEPGDPDKDSKVDPIEGNIQDSNEHDDGSPDVDSNFPTAAQRETTTHRKK